MEQNSNELKQYKYKIGFEQGANGVLRFNAYIHFDDENEFKDTTISYNAGHLAEMLSLAEYHFKRKGYNVASDVKQKVGSDKTKDE